MAVDAKGDKGGAVTVDFDSPADPATVLDWFNGRSAAHTSELQSLMRTSYAVFCLIKTKCLAVWPTPAMNRCCQSEEHTTELHSVDRNSHSVFSMHKYAN